MISYDQLCVSHREKCFLKQEWIFFVVVQVKFFCMVVSVGLEGSSGGRLDPSQLTGASQLKVTLGCLGSRPVEL